MTKTIEFVPILDLTKERLLHSLAVELLSGRVETMEINFYSKVYNHPVHGTYHNFRDMFDAMEWQEVLNCAIFLRDNRNKKNFSNFITDLTEFLNQTN